jgi:hypothetical protein
MLFCSECCGSLVSGVSSADLAEATRNLNEYLLLREASKCFLPPLLKYGDNCIGFFKSNMYPDNLLFITRCGRESTSYYLKSSRCIESYHKRRKTNCCLVCRDDKRNWTRRIPALSLLEILHEKTIKTLEIKNNTLKRKAKRVQQKFRRFQIRIASEQQMQRWFDEKVHIDIDDAEQMSACLKFLCKRLDEEFKDAKNAEEQEMCRLRKDLMMYSIPRLGKKNKAGDRRGMGSSIPASIMAYYMERSCRYSESQYERERKLFPEILPAYSTLRAHKRTFQSTPGINFDSLNIAEEHCKGANLSSLEFFILFANFWMGLC